MKRSISGAVLVILMLVFGMEKALPQGAFSNLDFENPVIPLTPVNSQVPTMDAIPGWTAYTYGSSLSTIFYNTVSLGAAAVSLQGPGSAEPVPHGSYFVVLQGSTASTPGAAAIGQIGQIPMAAESLTFWGYAAPNDVSFNGQTLSLQLLASAAHYNIYAADISTYAGQTGQLLFTTPPNQEDYIDDIQFSPSSVPEPETWTLLLWAALSCGAARKLLKQ